jgi:hypothetical protein
MARIKVAAAAVAAVVLAGCATPPMPPIATHTFVILTVADNSAVTDKATLAALQAHPLWLPQYGELRRAAVEAISQRLTHDQGGWRMAPAVDVSLIALAATPHDDGRTLIGDWGEVRPGVAELIKRLDVDTVFVVTERPLAKGPLVVGQVQTYDGGGILMGWEQVAIEAFDRTRLPGKEATGLSMTERILETTTPEARTAMLKDLDMLRRDLEDMLREHGY